jgi:hypothetical protein
MWQRYSLPTNLSASCKVALLLAYLCLCTRLIHSVSLFPTENFLKSRVSTIPWRPLIVSLIYLRFAGAKGCVRTSYPISIISMPSRLQGLFWGRNTFRIIEINNLRSIVCLRQRKGECMDLPQAMVQQRAKYSSWRDKKEGFGLMSVSAKQ